MLWRFALAPYCDVPCVRLIKLDRRVAEVTNPILPTVAIEQVLDMLKAGEVEGARALMEGWFAAWAERIGLDVAVSHRAEPDLLELAGIAS